VALLSKGSEKAVTADGASGLLESRDDALDCPQGRVGSRPRIPGRGCLRQLRHGLL